jgi:hypothetical protein
MEFTKISELRKYVHSQLNNCPLPLIDQEVVRCIRHFCEQTHAWVHELPPIRIRADKRDYQLRLADEVSGCAEIERVKFAREVRDPTNSPDGRLLDTDCDWVLVGDDRLTFRYASTPTETVSKGLRVTVVLRPKRSADQWECNIFEKYYDYIADGSLARLKKMARKPWTDLTGGVLAESNYYAGLALARSEVARGYTDREITNTMNEAFFV